ncbi:dihydrolipoamide dehydrogenase [Methanomicrobium sp. W14]|uniref:FAD-dependent oxidoreductase n=1 Tax=Methanomicrobium sp. W14 TaxID=2817839 RepID=UPI001AE3EBA0|nr:NAD(P)/FAD-dependent oxidoreductase [Methanomicrobium sp. W14]MBP2134314.1 dihydrolipoamide dehydrogenase [Methanomicrobium sp. W14]
MITVIGGGPAGRFAAIHLAGAGEEVRLIERRGKLGGQCLHQGCMVICGLNDCARLIDESEKLGRLNVLKNHPGVSLPDLWDEMNNIQAKISDILDRETKGAGVSVTDAEAFVDGSTVTVNGEILSSESVLIATGSKPFVPDIPNSNLPGVYTPHTIFNMRNIPKKLVIVGGGVIAAEYSYIFSMFGSDVTVASRSQFLRGKPDLLRRSALKDLHKVSIKEYTLVRNISGKERAESVFLESGGEKMEFKCDAVLFASGLTPNTGNITGIKKGEHGEIIIDEGYRTNCKGVYAAGDVTGRVFMTPYARMQGINAARSILGEKPLKIPEYIPQSLKLFYEHSYCNGNTENTSSVSIPSPSGPGSFWSVPEKNTGNAMINVDRKSGDIKGMYLGSPSSSVVAAYMGYLMEKGLNVSDFEDFVEVHPSTDGVYGLIKYAYSLLK